MKELLKNKIMIGLLVFVIGVTYINTKELKKYEEKIKTDDIVMNIK